MDLTRSLGLRADGTSVTGQRDQLIQYINLKLAALGQPTAGNHRETEFLEVARDLLAQHREYSRLLDEYLCPADQRIQDFLDRHLDGESLNGPIRLPRKTFVLDRHGLARELSLPYRGDFARSELLESYRIRQGVLHNPKSDRRTTQGVFHVAEGGLPIPADKIAVPLRAYGNLLHAALNPPAELLRIPFTADSGHPVEMFCSLLLRPTVVPEVPGFSPRKTMEIRFFYPGSLVCNLDFVESIFGNAGDPYLPDNDAALDTRHWTGHTGCVILAPHLQQVRKKAVGLPHWDEATPRQREQGMCYKSEDELYNGGRAFKITCRTEAGVMVTILADNYFGYSKKEVKTQISFAANLYGLAEEEHAGGALAFASYSLGDLFNADSRPETGSQSFDDMVALLGDRIEVKEEGYGIDRNFPSIVYLPQSVKIELHGQKVSWSQNGVDRSMKLLPDRVYVCPSGYKVRMEKHPGAPSWRLVGTVAEGAFCHKPCTVSGGGKSEISKSIVDSIVYGPIYVADFEEDMKRVEEILGRDYADRFLDKLPPGAKTTPSRPILSPARTLGSVIKLLTPSPGEYTDAYNAWLEEIPNRIRSLVFFIKRFYKPEWGENWREHFHVDEVNGASGNELKLDERRAVGSYLRIGFTHDGKWRLYKLRQDFIAADKVQMEDDISASAIVPTPALSNRPKEYGFPSAKLVENCEYRLFQRPDEAIHRGFDKQTEHDMAQPGLFASNYAPVTAAEAREIVENTMSFEQFTLPMRENLRAAAERADGYVVSSAHPRVVDGKLTKNPRYLQIRPDVARPRDRYLAEIGTRLFRRVPAGERVVFPVSAVLCGRRNNPADPVAKIRALAVFNPIHYQELPELFMDFVCSLTGKSPSTTGAGSEGALTKGPFNALLPAPDLNNALVGYILTGYPGYSSAAGYVGANVRVDHDISLLIPEIWTRLTPAERDPQFLISRGYLEKMGDFEYHGRRVLASRLGYRITAKFVHAFFGRVFDNPAKVFTDEILRPETQDMAAFVDGIDNIVEAQQRVARGYYEDGSFEALCPPLQALIRIMAGDPDPGTADAADVRGMFTRENLLKSDWYAERLRIKQRRDVALWQRNVASLERFLNRTSYHGVAERMEVTARLDKARKRLEEVRSPAYVEQLVGTIGADPLHAAPPRPAMPERQHARVEVGKTAMQAVS